MDLIIAEGMTLISLNIFSLRLFALSMMRPAWSSFILNAKTTLTINTPATIILSQNSCIRNGIRTHSDV